MTQSSAGKNHEGPVEVSEAEFAVLRLNHAQQKQLFCCAMTGDLEKGVQLWLSLGSLVTLEEVEEQALALRNMSEVRCHFCGEPNSHQTGWRFSPENMHSAMTWQELSNVACQCLNSFRSSRRTLFNGWQSRLAEISAKYHAGVLSGDRVLYTDVCIEPGCSQLFKVVVRNAAVSWVAHKRFTGWTRCPACVKKKLPAANRAHKTGPSSNVGTVTARRAPRLNALTKLGDSSQIREALEKLSKGG